MNQANLQHDKSTSDGQGLLSGSWEGVKELDGNKILLNGRRLDSQALGLEKIGEF